MLARQPPVTTLNQLVHTEAYSNFSCFLIGNAHVQKMVLRAVCYSELVQVVMYEFGILFALREIRSALLVLHWKPSCYILGPPTAARAYVERGTDHGQNVAFAVRSSS